MLSRALFQRAGLPTEFGSASPLFRQARYMRAVLGL